MSSEKLPHARWLIQQLTRDEEGALCIAPSSVVLVEERIREALDDAAIRDEFMDEILRLAQGALDQGGEEGLARTLVKLVLDHPAGQARLEKSGASKAWAEFVAKPVPRAPSVGEKAPEGSVSVSSLLSKLKR